ncbi:MAG: type IV toxin-antitoxin system AbiEi family antitoxin domain-containing protein [Deltaproteobacteria bacterium]|nr:type IV toxin-antitoxin system AbiEi family antitoxin domain-containing protein [Deltaproteobacteria bacterium]
MNEQLETIAGIFRKKGGVLRMSEALRLGISRRTLYAMLDFGIIERISRGVYRLVGLPSLESPDLVAVATRIPKGVVCLISALAFHDLTTQVPHAVDVAIQRGSEMPRVDYPPMNIYWFSGRAFTEAIETHSIDGITVKVYSPEKSLADIFKYRNKLGIEVTLEALQTWRSRSGGSVEKLLIQAKNCRVENVIRPYLEALL